MSRRRVVLSVVVLAVTVAQAQGIEAQGRASTCEPRSFRVLRSEETFGYRTTWVGLPNVVCADGVRIQADSAVLYDAIGRSEFIGSFRYQDAERELRAQSADYYELEGRLFARGDVEVVSADGTEIRGDTLTLYELGPGPDDDQIQVSGPPAFARLTPGEAPEGGPPAEPFEVYGLRLRMEGDRLFLADGEVVATRDSLRATAASLNFERASGNLRLTGDAFVESPDAVFRGDEVDLAIPQDELTGITLRGRASLVSDDLEVRGDEIRIDVGADDVIEHLVAVRRGAATDPGAQVSGVPAAPAPPGVPAPALAPAAPTGAPATATAPGTDPAAAPPEEAARPEGIARGFEITADSLDVVAPAGTLQTLTAVGRARGVSRPDSADAAPPPPDTARTAETAATLERLGVDPGVLDDDWIEGDTIVATFTPAIAGESAEEGESEYVLDRLVAMGNARTIYRYPPEDEEPGGQTVRTPDRSRWSINYVVANRITLTLDEGRVEGAVAEGQVTGGYLEPIEPSAAAADSVATPPADSVPGNVAPPPGPGAAP